MRAVVARNAWQITLVSTAIRVVVFVGLAWAAAFRRQNWARWSLLVVFILSHAAPLILAMKFGRMAEFLSRYHDWQADLIALVLALALAFAFTGNARSRISVQEWMKAMRWPGMMSVAVLALIPAAAGGQSDTPGDFHTLPFQAMSD